MKTRLVPQLALCLCVTVAVSDAGPAQSQDFYRGKTIDLLISSGPGGGYDLYARFLGRHIDRHIPGTPNVVPKNMPGGGGMTVLNFAYNTAAQDGTVIFTLHQNLPMYQRLGQPGVKYDARKIRSVGRLSAGNEALFADPRAGVKGYKDLYDRELVIGGTGVSSNSVVYSTLARNLLGLKFKAVPGYPGTSQIRLAMERGEVHGMSMTLASMYAGAPQLLEPGAIVPLIQFGTQREKEWPDAPTPIEIAKTDEDRQAFEILTISAELGRSYWVGPGVPGERLKVLRAAFDKMIEDPKVLEEGKRQKLLLRFASGQEMDKYVARVFQVTDSAVARLKSGMPKREKK